VCVLYVCLHVHMGIVTDKSECFSNTESRDHLGLGLISIRILKFWVQYRSTFLLAAGCVSNYVCIGV
jgi:hypothetical protein